MSKVFWLIHQFLDSISKKDPTMGKRVADDSDDNIPWMALLLIREDEMKRLLQSAFGGGDGVLVSSLVGPSNPQMQIYVLMPYKSRKNSSK